MYVCVCVCVHVFVCMYVTNVCKNISIFFQFQVAYRMKNGMYAYDCVRACVYVSVCVCVCVRDKWLHIYV